MSNIHKVFLLMESIECGVQDNITEKKNYLKFCFRYKYIKIFFHGWEMCCILCLDWLTQQSLVCFLFWLLICKTYTRTTQLLNHTKVSIFNALFKQLFHKVWRGCESGHHQSAHCSLPIGVTNSHLDEFISNVSELWLQKPSLSDAVWFCEA